MLTNTYITTDADQRLREGLAVVVQGVSDAK
ncbi:hypothetical protein GGR95_001354 [Sulfitobacter undariae]|uniref:Uncharacterized protein n=1 Tax=Sulfitobacter undariae TaxID=1563671 RepID=A0A7W6H0K9_9RHOB|nr:hypothetical protein [Sulfitobacter undariae]